MYTYDEQLRDTEGDESQSDTVIIPNYLSIAASCYEEFVKTAEAGSSNSTDITWTVESSQPSWPSNWEALDDQAAIAWVNMVKRVFLEGISFACPMPPVTNEELELLPTADNLTAE